MPLSIRKATSHHSDVIIRMLRALYLELGEESESIAFLKPALIAKLIRNKFTEIYLLEENTTIVGLISITETQAIYAGGKYGVIDEMYVVPEFRKKGAGRKMIEFAKHIAVRKKWLRIDVTAPTESRWKNVISFYEANDFTFTGPKMKFIVAEGLNVKNDSKARYCMALKMLPTF
jgi:GNAT superfamily N-acetyltransferase